MSFVRRQIYVNKDNFDIFDTLNEPFMESIPNGMVTDTQENRLNAAIACIYSLAKQLRETKHELYVIQYGTPSPERTSRQGAARRGRRV